MRKFDVGDKVRVKCPTSIMGYNGRETVVVGILRNHLLEGTEGLRTVSIAYSVDLMGSNGLHCAYPPHELEPIYDGDEPVSWSDCVWQPNKQRV